ncbi:MAG: two-component regulator propeller domain-containing protein [Prolixibacteraceae bacterium]
MEFTTISALENISNNKVSSIIQDSNGNLWIGSDGGLFRFDGQTVYAYEHDANDLKSLPSGKINKLFIDSAKKLWVCTAEGICTYNPEYDNFELKVSPSNLKGLFGASVNVISEDKKGQIYVAYQSSLFTYDRTNDLFICLVKLNQGNITAMTFDSSNNVWIASASNGGLFYFDQQKQKVRIFKNDPTKKNTIGSNEINDIALIGENLWIATYGNGIDVYQINNDVFKHYVSNEYYENFVKRIFVDKKKAIWICTLGNLKLYNPEDDNFFNYNNQLNNPKSVGKGLIDFYEDNQGNYWSLYALGGIRVVKKKNKFKHFDTQPDYFWHTSERNITAVSSDASGNFWIGNFYNGLDVFNWGNHTIDRFLSDNRKSRSIGGGTLFCIFRDSKKQMWVGSNFGGLQRFNPKTKNFISFTNDIYEPNSIASNDVRSISEDNKGNLWLAVHGNGVDYFKQKENIFLHFNSQNNKLSNDFTYQAISDSTGNLWVATANGLNFLSEGDTIFTNYFFDKNDSTSISDNEIHALHIDNDQNLWVGTSNGLNQFDRGTNSFIRYSLGLRNKNVVGILSDRKNNIWVSTYGGISKLNKENKTFITFDQTDGLISREFYDRACYRNEKNEMFFGGSEGLDVFNPDSLILEEKKPIVHLTDFKLFNKSVNYRTSPEILDKHISHAKDIWLTYKSNSFTILYQTVTLVNPEKVSYSYRLDNFDSNWILADNRREANYTNLEPGDYKFRVKAKYDKGEWSEDEMSVGIHIKPAWWMRMWVKVLFIIFILTTFSTVVFMRIRALNIQHARLESIVADRTNEIVIKNDLLESQTKTLTERNDQLKDLNSTRDKLFSIISHDLRSPFNTILGFEELLLDNYSELSDEERKDMISQLYKTSNQTYDLVENMLNWARIQTRNIKYAPKKFDLYEFFERKFDLYQKIAENKGITLQNSLAKKLIVYADANFLETILRNLINNAIKFTPTGGNIRISSEPGENSVIISVADSGVGMTQNQIDSLFYIDKNKSTSGTNGENGSGLGLILCKEFVEEYNGTIAVKSEPGKGSTFSFTVPVTTSIS